MSCLKKCEHERHQIYLSAFSVLSIYDFVEFITKFVLDPNISPDNADDLELFQDFVFSDRLGRLHVFYYHNMFEDRPDANELLIKAYCQYLNFLGQISSFFQQESLEFIFRWKPFYIESILKLSSPQVKLDIIKISNNYPEIIKRIPKLKLYNLFS